jgi:hypothetical protein
VCARGKDGGGHRFAADPRCWVDSGGGEMIPELVGSFDRSLTFMRGLVADLSDEEMVLQPPGAPNHAAWTLGHVIHSCQAIAAELGVVPWLPHDWEARFGYGSAPAAAAGSSPVGVFV